jgi:2-methylcitrate dehydratase PrpD
MDFDLNTAAQSVTGVIPAILLVAETTGATPSEMLAAFIVAVEIAARLFRAAPQGWRGTAGMAPARLAPPRRQSTRVVGSLPDPSSCSTAINPYSIAFSASAGLRLPIKQDSSTMSFRTRRYAR